MYLEMYSLTTFPHRLFRISKRVSLKHPFYSARYTLDINGRTFAAVAPVPSAVLIVVEVVASTVCDVPGIVAFAAW